MPTARTANTSFVLLRLSMRLRVMIAQWLNGKFCVMR